MTISEDPDLPTIALSILERADMAYLSTVGPDGYPHTRAMFNLRNPSWFPKQAPIFADHADDFLVYLTTNTSSWKIRQLMKDPRASIYYCLPLEYEGLLLVGDLEAVDDTAIRHAVWNEGWERYYPGGPDDPDHTVLRMRPQKAEGWHQSRRFAFEL
jgi:general stress protein 26